MSKSIFMDFSIKKIVDFYKKRKIGVMEVAKLCIKNVNGINSNYKAWVSFDSEKLLKNAKISQERILKGEQLGFLEGIPVGVKDTINTNDFPTQMGSPIWKDFTPGNDARVVFNLKESGAIIAGKTDTAEFGVHSLGLSLNPHDITRTPGTSSSGSAIAVSTGMVPITLGTQTAGSIIRPASFCGIYGVKSSFGLIPRTGTLKTTDSLDSLGYFAYHFEDLENIFDVVRVHGSNYPLSNNALSDKERQSCPKNRPWKIGFVRTNAWSHAEVYAKESILKWAKKLALTNDIDVVEISLPASISESHLVHETIYNKTLSYYFKDELKYKKLISPIMKKMIDTGNEITLDEYKNALDKQEQLAQSMDEFFHEYDILFTLSTAGHAPKREEIEKPDSALIWNMTYLPVISAPVFKSPEGLPFGLQLIARRYNDLLLFRFANYLRDLDLIPYCANDIFNFSKNLNTAKQVRI